MQDNSNTQKEIPLVTLPTTEQGRGNPCQPVENMQHQERYRIALEAAGMVTWEWNLLTHEVFLSANVVEVLGLPSTATITSSQEFFNCIHPDDRQRVIQALEVAAAEKSEYSAEYRVLIRDGSLRWVQHLGRVSINSEGTAAYISGVMMDISARKQREEQRDRFFAVGADLLAIANFDGYFTWVSPSWENTFGWTAKELTVQPWLSFVHPEDREKTRKAGQQLGAGNEVVAFENRYRCKDGSYRWLSWRRQPLVEEKSIYSTAIDVTAQKLAEAARKESEERFRLMAERAPVMIWMTDPTGYCTYLSQSWYNFTGQSESEGLGLGWIDAVHPEDRATVKNVFLEATKHREAFHLDYRLQRDDGEYRFCIDSASPCFGANEQFLGYIGSVIDITERKHAQAAAEKHRRLLKAVTDNASVALFIMDEQQQCVFMNPAAEQMTGFALAEVQGRALHDIIHHTRPDGSHYPLEECPIDRAFPENNQEQGEEVFVHKDGNFYHVSYTASPIRDAGEIRGTIIEVRDITEEKQAEARFRLMADSIPQLAWMANPDGWIFWYNQRWYDYTGTTPQQMEGWGWQSVHAPDELPKVKARWQHSIATGEPFDLEFPLRGADGEFRWFLTRVNPMKDAQGNVVLWFGTNTDVTHQRQLAQERAALLETERAAREQAEKANRVRDEFLAVLSHELRSPLNPIIGWVKLLKSGRLNPEKTAQAIDIIERNAKLQVDLIADLLDVSRILQGKLSLNVSTVSLPDTISAAIETVRLAAQAKSIKIDTAVDTTVEQVVGDAARLQQIVWNLLSNAVKFTPKGGRVEIRLSCVGADAQITVSDTGKGIRPDFLPYIFEYFRQEDASTTRQYGGLGLGLAIVKQLVELHGGTVQATSQGEDKGATFIVTLPLIKPHSQIHAASTTSKQVTNLSGISVLVVDDERDSRELIAFALELFGATVSAVASAREALQALHSSTPDVLVSDIGMPDMDGYQLLRQVRTWTSNSNHRQIVAIALTAYAGEFDQRQALAAGFQMHIAKPVEPEALATAVAQLVQSR
ncbi:MAG TPA: PAS domain S-box protein [Cyanobacteria bacterium UBA11049]|nr:PAS domain S-box protein [Cyanobacteria bacterium UBA11049]